MFWFLHIKTQIKISINSSLFLFRSNETTKMESLRQKAKLSSAVAAKRFKNRKKSKPPPENNSHLKGIWGGEMAMLRKLFYRKPPDGLLEISDQVYVFECCFTTNAWDAENYKVYIRGIFRQLRDDFPDASFLVFNFHEGETQSQMADILSEYDVTIMDYPRHYEGCPLLKMELLHHFLRSCESWLSLGQQNLLLMHCEQGGWLVLAFMLAALLIYRKQYNGEHKILDMIYRQAPPEILQLLSALDPVPSQLRYLQYVSRRNVVSRWPPLDQALTLDCIMLRSIPNFDGEGGCRPIFCIYGQDPIVPDRTTKLLYATAKKSKSIRYYRQKESELVKIDINCHIQGDVVLECINLKNDMEGEEMMFRVAFNTAFIRSNILIVNLEEIDILWNAKDLFPKDFRAEIIFSDMDASSSIPSFDFSCFEDDVLPIDAFAKVHEIFSHVEWLGRKSDVALNVLQQISASNTLNERADGDRDENSPTQGGESPKNLKEETKSRVSSTSLKSSPSFGLKIQLVPLVKPSLDTEALSTLSSPIRTPLSLNSSAFSFSSSKNSPDQTQPASLPASESLHSSISKEDGSSLSEGSWSSVFSLSPESLAPFLASISSASGSSLSPSVAMPSLYLPLSAMQPTELKLVGNDVADVTFLISDRSIMQLKENAAVVHEPAKAHMPSPAPASPQLSPSKEIPTSIGPQTGNKCSPIPTPPTPPMKDRRAFESPQHAVSPQIPSPPDPPLKGKQAVNMPEAPQPPAPPPPPLPSSKSVEIIAGISAAPTAPLCAASEPSSPLPPPSLTSSLINAEIDGSLADVRSGPPSPPPHSQHPPSPAKISLVPPPPTPPLAPHLPLKVVCGPPPSPPPIHSQKPESSAKLSSVPPPPPLAPHLSPNIRFGPPHPPPPPIDSRKAVSSAKLSSAAAAAPPPPPPPVLHLSPNLSNVPSAPPPPGKGTGSMGSAGFSSPAPPPPFCPPNSRNKLSRSISLKSQTKKLKPLHWLKLNRVVQGSLWAEAQKLGEASKGPEIDMSELESLFSAAVPGADQRGKSYLTGSRGPKTDKVQLIDHRRAYNCEIMLSKVKIPLPDLMSSVLALEESALDADQVDNVIKFCPTKEEMEVLKSYNGEKEKLGKCEQFFLELMKVPRVEIKLRIFSFKTQFCSQVNDLRNSLNVVNSVADEIRNSVKLKRIMQTILSLGNALNQGTARGSAIGFRLDSLLKLTETRARNNKMTLMHYLCKVLADKIPELLDFSEDLSSLEPSSKVQLKFLAEEMQAISKGLEKIVEELSCSENDGPVSDKFHKNLKEFLCFAEAEVRSLASLYSVVGRNVDALILYFGEDPARCSFEQVVSTLLNFVRMFNNAHEENCKQQEIEMKKSLENK